MPSGWEGNRRSGVRRTGHASQTQWSIHYGLNGLCKGDEQRAYTQQGYAPFAFVVAVFCESSVLTKSNMVTLWSVQLVFHDMPYT